MDEKRGRLFLKKPGVDEPILIANVEQDNIKSSDSSVSDIVTVSKELWNALVEGGELVPGTVYNIPEGDDDDIYYEIKRIPIGTSLDTVVEPGIYMQMNNNSWSWTTLIIVSYAGSGLISQVTLEFGGQIYRRAKWGDDPWTASEAVLMSSDVWETTPVVEPNVTIDPGLLTDVYKTSNGIVNAQMSFQVSGAASVAGSWITIATLNDGFRPKAEVLSAGHMGSGDTIGVRIQPNGDVAYCSKTAPLAVRFNVTYRI